MFREGILVGKSGRIFMASWLERCSRVGPRWVALLLLAGRLALGAYYSLAVPVFEGFDEHNHYAYVRYIATKRHLLRPHDPDAGALFEKFQPPLYYILAAPFVSWVDVSDDYRPALNRFFPSPSEGPFFHLPAQREGFPFRQTVLAIHLLRLVSVGIATLGILFTYLTARAIAPEDRRLAIGALLVHALWPQVLFNASTVNNDVLVATMGSIVAYLLAKVAMDREGRGGPVVALGLFLGLAMLSKLTALALLPVGLLAIAWKVADGLRRSRGRAKWGTTGVLSLIPILLAVRLLRVLPYIRVLRSEDTIGVVDWPARMAKIARQVLRWESLGFAWRTLGYSSRTAYGSFGWHSVELPLWLSWLMLALVLVALLGVAKSLRRSTGAGRWGVSILCAAFLSVYALVVARGVYLTRPCDAPGRYMLPGITAFSVLAALGWLSLAPGRFRWHLAAAGLAFMVAVALFVPAFLLPSAYARAPLLKEEDLPPTRERVNAQFGDIARVLGYRSLEREARPGGHIELEVFWQALKSTDGYYRIRLDIVAPDGQGYGLMEAYPARSNFPTSLWKAGDIFQARYLVPIAEQFPAPAKALLTLGMVENKTDAELPLGLDGSIAKLGDRLVLGAFGVRGGDADALCQGGVKADYRLGEEVELVGYHLKGLPEVVEVTLCWKALRVPADDYTVFVHLRDAQGRMLSQDDGQPRRGAYPTSLWSPGEVVADLHRIPIGEGCTASPCNLYVGMYKLATLERLPVFSEEGERLPSDEIPLGTMSSQ